MTHKEARNLLDPYLDGELDLHASLDFERHAATCSECTWLLTGHHALRQSIRSEGFAFAPPAALARSVRREVGKESQKRYWPGLKPVPAFGALAALALVILLLIEIPRFTVRPSDAEAEQILQSHLRSLMLNHLVDVPSSDQHTVKPWFDGKVDYSPEVKDFASEGFELVGGRLDVVNDRPVSVLVYQRRKHIINLFCWPAAGSEKGATERESRRGYNFISWDAGGMRECAVSDLNPEELAEFVNLWRR